jgi:hypothetical protein
MTQNGQIDMHCVWIVMPYWSSTFIQQVDAAQQRIADAVEAKQDLMRNESSRQNMYPPIGRKWNETSGIRFEKVKDVFYWLKHTSRRVQLRHIRDGYQGEIITFDEGDSVIELYRTQSMNLPDIYELSDSPILHLTRSTVSNYAFWCV